MRTTMLAATLVASLTAAAAANANPYNNSEGFFLDPYVGAGATYTDFKDAPTGVEDSYTGGEVHVGARLHKHFGIEGGYFATETGEDDSLGVNVESKFRGANLDLMGFAPVTENLELIGSVGATYTEGEISAPGLGSAEGDDWDLRYGAGAQYWLTDDVNMRAMVHYVDDPDASDAVVGSVGMNLHF